MEPLPHKLYWKNWGEWLAGAGALSIKALPCYLLAASMFGGFGLTIYLMGGKALYHLFNISSPFFLIIVAIAFAKDTGAPVAATCYRQISKGSYWLNLPRLSAKPILVLLVGMHFVFIGLMLYSQYFASPPHSPGQGTVLERSFFEQAALYVILFSTTIEQQMILVPPLILFGGIYHFVVNIGLSLGVVAEGNADQVNSLVKVSGKRVLLPVLIVLPAGVVIQAAAKAAGNLHQALGAGVLLVSTFGWLFFGALSWKIVASVMAVTAEQE
ncbi:hypothetical protein BLL42_27340 (plasmid) [Pseudomonas frederiksbergensis]|uniref:Uncharacterized protein n=1 Tax=Pseudomonas frederiksbergensis TaxID=104087 RepID=A0A1J0EUI2_9PSED|nr:hypothetical protein [Pseudomonas frederiksbergensis]APC19452.1 hypothetical protein BLL42_27340 [Pseudomonas frederiksbergensis]